MTAGTPAAGATVLEDHLSLLAAALLPLSWCRTRVLP